MQFLTFDFNGWFDYVFDENDNNCARALGFRSCLFKHEGQWLAGAQALAAARFMNSLSATISAKDALASAAGLGHQLLEREETSTLPTAMWKLVEDASRTTESPINLALVIPDDQDFGNPKVVYEGKTRLEILYNAIHAVQPASLIRSRTELVWRSVAILQAVLEKGELKDETGAVLVVSVNEKILWSVLELRRWSRSDSDRDSIQIVRTQKGKRGEIPWLKDLLTSVEGSDSDELEKLSQWTRWLDIQATKSLSGIFDQLGIDENAIEHRTWQIVDGECESRWTDIPKVKLNNCITTSLQRKLEEVITNTQGDQNQNLLAIIIENPINEKIVPRLKSLNRILGDKINCHYVSGAETIRAAALLAKILAETNHPNSPAWLDSVPEILLKVRSHQVNENGTRNNNWIPVVSKNEVVPAGELYSTQPDQSRQITVAPGIEFIHLHLRRLGEDSMDERYTRHAIEPSDHVRVVEPLARVRPLSEVARIEIVEHLPNDSVETLAGPNNGIKWDELTSKPPDELRSIPELFVFKASEEGWRSLQPILEQIVESPNFEARIELRSKLYDCTQQQWQDSQFPLGSDGQPPRIKGGMNHDYNQKLLRNAQKILVNDLVYCVDKKIKLSVGIANRLHLGLTWLFTGCPEKVTDILIEAVKNPNGKEGFALKIDKDYAAWSIYSGVGRTAANEESLRFIYDNLITQWEDHGQLKQDKFLLAAVSHPLARRYLARQILNEDKERFQRVKRFLCQQLDNIIYRNSDPRPNPRRSQPVTELQYVIMGFRGLCQIRYKNAEWFPADGPEARKIYEKFYHRVISSQIKNIKFEKRKQFVERLLNLSIPYLVGEGVDPTMPSGF